MKIILNTKQLYVLRFDKDEEVLTGIITFATEQKITAATFSAIGASSQVTLAYYDLEKKEYHDQTLYDDMEILSITGNIGQMKEKPIIHAHGIFGDSELATHGGHIKAIKVSATCEVTLTVLEGELNRTFDPETGLNLLS
mgnify:CR=1 FL=1